MSKVNKGLRDIFREVLFPGNIYCIGCGMPIKNEGGLSLCGECRRKMLGGLPESCGRCGHFVRNKRTHFCGHCAAVPPVYDRGRAAVVYGKEAKKIIFALKYGGKGYLADNIAYIMTDAVKSMGDYDIIVPVPMHKSKKSSRGFCHTTLISNKLGEITGKPVSGGNLVRIKKTGAMSGLSPEERRNNIRGAFEVRNGKEFAGKTVLLTDDLLTTGSTADECAGVLLKAGAEKVYLAVFASPYENYD
ncbi:MAG: ComF family protein [Bacillota bacterium]|nr:ComF family protein [Bacillota bacterium]